MPRRLSYAIVEDEHPAMFIDDINQFLEDGFKLHGGMTVDNGKYYQALIKNEMDGGRRTRKTGKGRKSRNTRKASKSRKSRK
jgi:hypothetical protein